MLSPSGWCELGGESGAAILEGEAPVLERLSVNRKQTSRDFRIIALPLYYGNFHQAANYRHRILTQRQTQD